MVRPIGKAEKRLIPAGGLSLYLFYPGMQCSRYGNWSNVFVNEIYLKRFISQLIKKGFYFNTVSDRCKRMFNSYAYGLTLNPLRDNEVTVKLYRFNNTLLI